MKPIFTLIISMLILSGTMVAQTFELGGQIRPRAEYRHGYRSLIGDDVKPGFSISQRTRLNMNYSTKLFISNISIQNVRVWGDVSTSNKSDLNDMMVHQAWGELFLTKKIAQQHNARLIVTDNHPTGSNFTIVFG